MKCPLFCCFHYATGGCPINSTQNIQTHGEAYEKFQMKKGHLLNSRARFPFMQFILLSYSLFLPYNHSGPGYAGPVYGIKKVSKVSGSRLKIRRAATSTYPIASQLTTIKSALFFRNTFRMMVTFLEYLTALKTLLFLTHFVRIYTLSNPFSLFCFTF